MKKSITLGVLLLLMSVTVSAQTKKVGMLIGSETIDDISSADEKKAAQWFTAAYPEGVVVTPSTLSNMNDVDVLWVACDRVSIEKGWEHLPTAFSAEATVNALKSFAQNGGSLLLTNHATQLAVAIERIEAQYAPNLFGSGGGSQNNDDWGVHPVIGNVEGQIYNHKDHAIYKDMTYMDKLYAGIYRFEGGGFKGDHNCMWDMNAIIGLTANPNKIKDFEDKTNSTVLGTWNHVVDYCCAGIVDFEPTTTIKGRILAVGLAAYEWDLNDGDNPYIDQLQLFTANCISYLKSFDKVIDVSFTNETQLGTQTKYAATFYSDMSTQLPTGILAYTATIDGNTLTLNKVNVDKIPANTGVFLVADDTKTYNFHFYSYTPESLGTNAFEGVTEATTGSALYSGDYSTKTLYVLAKSTEKKLGFYKLGKNSTPVGANRAFLVVDGSSSVRSFTLNLDDEGEVTSIADIRNKMEDAGCENIYNVQGQRMSELQRGINIVNGKKVIIK